MNEMMHVHYDGTAATTFDLAINNQGLHMHAKTSYC